MAKIRISTQHLVIQNTMTLVLTHHRASLVLVVRMRAHAIGGQHFLGRESEHLGFMMLVDGGQFLASEVRLQGDDPLCGLEFEVVQNMKMNW